MWSFVVGCLVVLAIAFFITDRVLIGRPGSRWLAPKKRASRAPEPAGALWPFPIPPCGAAFPMRKVIAIGFERF